MSFESDASAGALGIRGADFADGLMAKVLAGLFISGASLSLLTVLLPHSSNADELGLILIVANAYLVGAALLRFANRLPPWALPLTLGWGTTLITGVAYFSWTAPSPLVFFYLWIFIFSAYFFTKRQAAGQVTYVAVAYGTLLISRPPEGGVAGWWLVGMGALLVAAIVIGTMRERVDMLITRLYDAARTDPLTMLLNRRGFREHLDLELERAQRGGSPVAILTGDVDHFKRVNDTAGHASGDIVLRRLATLMGEHSQATDTIARVGGEEFAVILPGTAAGDAFKYAEALRQVVRNDFASGRVQITISFGVSLNPEHGHSAAALLRAADEALYRAKEDGRNRTVLHSAAMSMEGLGGAPQDVEGDRFLAVMLSVADIVDLRFSGSARHSETVGRYAEMTARQLGFSENRVNRIRLAGMLHDIGKVGVPDAILHKPSKLDSEEVATIRRHPELGANILEHPSLADVRRWVEAHHERPDGKGYPRGLSAPNIEIEAKIVAV
ncbi:MAG: diguanylate cyclase, partial [Solirubrobacterales bacterium]|nr:diguanylate cyclase [Solirubrobacterales bacterium]